MGTFGVFLAVLLLRRLVLRLFTKFVLCAYHLAKLMRVVFGYAFIATNHSLIAGGH